MRAAFFQILLLAATAIWAAGCDKPLVAPSPQVSPQPAASRSPARTISGEVREVNGGAVAGVTIRSRLSVGNGSTDLGTNLPDGTFHIERFAQDFLDFFKDGYEAREWAVPKNAGTDAAFTVTVKMQPAINVVPGELLSGVITVDDLTYSSEGAGGDSEMQWDGNHFCGPCKLISASGLQAGATLSLSWSGNTPLTVWAGNYWEGPTAVVSGELDRSELVVKVPGPRFDTILLGVNRHGAAVFNGAPVAFRLVLTAP